MKSWLILILSFSLTCSQSPYDWGFMDEFDFLEVELENGISAHNSPLCLQSNDAGRNELHIAAIFDDYTFAYQTLVLPGNHILLYQRDDSGRIPEDYVNTRQMQYFFDIARCYYEVMINMRRG